MTETDLKEWLKQYSKGRVLIQEKWINTLDIWDIKILETPETTIDFGDKLLMEHPIFMSTSNAKNVTTRFFHFPTDLRDDLDFVESSEKRKRTRSPQSNDIFIVHGRDHKPVNELKEMLKESGLNSIVLHEQPGGSRTIAEKLEKYSDVGYAFVILTPDDIGVPFQELFERTARSSYESEALRAARRILEQSKGSIERFIEFNEKFMQDPADASKFLQFLVARARQNVILEFGYFMGLLGRERVCCLYKGDVELPSDMHGIVYVPFKESVNEKRDMIIKELKAAGYEIASEHSGKEKKDMEDSKDLKKEVEKLKDYLDRHVE